MELPLEAYLSLLSSRAFDRGMSCEFTGVVNLKVSNNIASFQCNRFKKRS